MEHLDARPGESNVLGVGEFLGLALAMEERRRAAKHGGRCSFNPFSGLGQERSIVRL